MNSFWQLFTANFKMFYREKEGFFWTIIMPLIIYCALSVIPLNKLVNSGVNYSSFVLPGIIAMTVMQGGIYSLAYWMVDLKARGVIKRLLAAPVKSWQLALSLVCSRLAIIFIQVALLTLAGRLFFHAQFAGNYLSIILLVALGAPIFLLMGLLISNYAKSYDAAAPITSGIGLPLTFLSNIFYPLDLLPNALQVIAKLLPVTYLADGLRQAYLYPCDIVLIGKDLFLLSLWLVFMALVTIKLFRLQE